MESHIGDDRWQLDFAIKIVADSARIYWARPIIFLKNGIRNERVPLRPSVPEPLARERQRNPETHDRIGHQHGQVQ
ncbi:MAG: hypothetical protein Q8R56_10160, partial [Polaromonas sp.]|nr:hypothetical protein [Polaromonas sp.]